MTPATAAFHGATTGKGKAPTKPPRRVVGEHNPPRGGAEHNQRREAEAEHVPVRRRVHAAVHADRHRDGSTDERDDDERQAGAAGALAK